MLIMYASLIEDPVSIPVFERIYNDYRLQMLYVAKKILANDADAEDAVQEAFTAIASQINSLPIDNPKLLKTYVLTAARNAAINIRDKSIARNNESIVCIDDHMLGSDDRLFEQVMKRLDYDVLMNALLKIPLKYREVLLLRYVYEFKHREIARLLGRKQCTVHQQLTRGKKLLIKQCRREGFCFEE